MMTATTRGLKLLLKLYSRVLISNIGLGTVHLVEHILFRSEKYGLQTVGGSQLFSVIMLNRESKEGLYDDVR